MNYDINPFQEVYVADSVDDTGFAKLFSEVPLMPAIHPMFQDGNVVLCGTQGCGKSMILRLLVPEIRTGFHASNIRFPVPQELRNFVSAGVNLTKSSICDVAQVSLGKGREHDIEQLPSFFADFFNWWILKDLFENLLYVEKRELLFDKMVDLRNERAFIAELTRQDCWFGFLDGCRTLAQIREKISHRISIYRKWVSFNDGVGRGIAEISETKTAIGEPLSRTVECLKASGFIKSDTRVFVRVDQLEELHQIGDVVDEVGIHRKKLRLAFRHVLNRAFGSRDGMVHYRIGTRQYGWGDRDLLLVQGSGDALEHRRNYLLIDIDEDLFRRSESSRAQKLFSRFAADAFLRRISYGLKLKDLPDLNQAASTFGANPSWHERSEYYGRPRSKAPAVGFEEALALEHPKDGIDLWSEEWRALLRNIYSESPLEGVLAAAWARQTGGGGQRKTHRESPPPKDRPWSTRKWWRKERLMQGVLQLAARRQQRLWWWGYQDVLALSGGNISVFLHICHQVWDQFLKVERLKPESSRIDLLQKDMAIPKEIQAIGIQNASKAWLEKLKERPAGDLRRQFVEAAGTKLRVGLRDDKAMRYPGANGFSVLNSELTSKSRPNFDMWQFLRDAGGYGALYIRSHTTKEKSGRSRTKFYLNPVLSPYFQIPVAHQKEPAYWGIEELFKLAKKAELPFMFDPSIAEKMPAGGTRKGKSIEDGSGNQLKLF